MTVRKWFTYIDSRPGISKPGLQILEDKLLLAQKKGKSLLYNVTVDDMTIRKHLHWNGKKYVGFINDTNDSDSKNKSTAMTTQVMVIIVVCLNEHWKIPVNYYFIDGLNGDERAQRVSQCLTNLYKIGINVVSLTFNGAQNNIRKAKALDSILQKKRAYIFRILLLKNQFL